MSFDSGPHPAEREPVDVMIDGSLSWATLNINDLPELVELKLAIDYFERPFEAWGFEEFMALWVDPLQEADRNAVIGRDSAGTAVAYAWNRVDVDDPNQLKVWLDGGIHPTIRHLDLSRRRLAWQVERVGQWMNEPEHEWAEEITCCKHINANNEMGQAVATQVGLEPFRWFMDMSLDLSHRRRHNIPDLGSVQIIPWDENLSDKTRQCHNLAFSTRVGSHFVDEENWYASYNRPDSRTDLSWLAIDQSEVVGYAISSIVETDDGDPLGGWTDRLGVRPDYRGRGIASALLQQSLKSFAEAKCSWAGIGVDTETPESSKRIYSRLGYQLDDAVILYQRVLTQDMDFPLGLLVD